jgi:hypothetical protein
MSQQESQQTQQESSFFQQVADARSQLNSMNLASHDNDSQSGCSSPELEADSSRASIASLQTPPSPASNAEDTFVADSFVYAFDIDGVLVRGGKAIPEAIQAMKVLNGENEYGIKV